ncbi:hypothetical protein DL93DRAFT_1321397 [Clavulina sp. PMI_390]|nr:hypothetical protein DL93DRAFT_1321397 [Clavulina sp. PMI_390]
MITLPLACTIVKTSSSSPYKAFSHQHFPRQASIDAEMVAFLALLFLETTGVAHVLNAPEAIYRSQY